jgi:23S rRNA (guanine745-N1)-methyltransferase
VCGLNLNDADNSLVCPNRHTFDRSRDGYVNLLPAGRLKGGVAGDSDDMIKARRAFFEAGHYRPIMDAVADAADGHTHVLDAGCGEGSYLAAVRAADRVGIDISKPAVRLAGRKFGSECRFAVASSFHLPFDDHVFDAVISVFAPRPFPEFARVLKPGGVAVVVSPGPDHLRGLTEMVYDEPEPHEQRPHTAAAEQRLQYDLNLDGPGLVQLLQMTPYWWKATERQRAVVAETSMRTVRADVVIARFGTDQL